MNPKFSPRPLLSQPSYHWFRSLLLLLLLMISIFFLSLPHFIFHLRKRKCFSENQYFPSSYSPAHLFFLCHSTDYFCFQHFKIFLFFSLQKLFILFSTSCLLACLWQQNNSGFIHTKAMSSFSTLFGMAAIFLGPHYGCKWDQHTHTQ